MVKTKEKPSSSSSKTKKRSKRTDKSVKTKTKPNSDGDSATKQKRKFLLSRLKKLPQSPGLYTWLDANGQPLYIGRAKNIRRRAKQHLDGTRDKKKTDSIVNGAADVAFKHVQQPGYMGRLEKMSVRTYKPTLNELTFT